MSIELRTTYSACSCGSCGACASRSGANRTSPQNISPAAGTAEQAGKTPEQATANSKTTGAQSLDDRYTPAEQKQIEELRARDREVRQHEAAHKTAAGAHARGGASYTYQAGPDGNRYAVGGEVNIDLSPVPGDPQATARKAEQIRSAALAPANPSGQDYAVAAAASRMATDAQMEAHTTHATSSAAEESNKVERSQHASPAVRHYAQSTIENTSTIDTYA